nr:hypothetical protein L203_05722 [Cryptococcus depauperatus CBS 7841]
MTRQAYSLLPTASNISSPTLTSKTRFFSRKIYIVFLAAFWILLGLWGILITLDDSVEQLNAWREDAVVSWRQADGWKAKVVGWLPQDKVNEKVECKGWDPLLPEELDPVECFKARQYRQTKRVLEREMELQHDHWYFTVEHNRETLQNMTRCFLPVADPNYISCPERPLVLSGWWYTAEVLNGATTGEVMWQRSVVKQLAMLGYFFVAVGPYKNWITVSEMMPDVYAVLWNSDVDIVSCITDPRCVAKEHYVPPDDAEDLSIDIPDKERGVIPLWALNVVDYWGARPKEISNNDYWWGLKEEGDWSFQPLGQEWIATPWPLPSHSHLPYTMEDTCLALPITPQAERLDSALLLAKRSAYFHYHHVSPPSFWSNLTLIDGVSLISTSNVDEGKPLPTGIETIGRKSVDEYTKLVGGVKAMIGIGAPVISPSAYTSLCQATPFVVPIFYEPPVDSEWRHYSGYSQHGPALRLGEPYVYSYHAHNYTSLLDAVKRAMATPIEPYIPDDMRYDYALPKLQEYLNRDLEAMMKEKVSRNGGRIPRLLKGARERCYELNRCRPLLESGRIPAVPVS